jgi:hypothetical protein
MMQDGFHQIGSIRRIWLCVNAFAEIRLFPCDSARGQPAKRIGLTQS